MGYISGVKHKNLNQPKMYWLYYNHKGSCFFNKTKNEQVSSTSKYLQIDKINLSLSFFFFLVYIQCLFDIYIYKINNITRAGVNIHL